MLQSTDQLDRNIIKLWWNYDISLLKIISSDMVQLGKQYKYLIMVWQRDIYLIKLIDKYM